MKPRIALTPQPAALPNRKPRTEQFAQVIAAAGGEPFVLDAGVTDLPGAHGLLLVGGGDPDMAAYDQPLTAAERRTLAYVDPALDAQELALVRWARSHDLPILGICRGLQMLNLALGGSLVADIRSRFPAALNHQHPDPFALAHALEWTAGTRLATWLATACPQVNSSHHQALAQVATGAVVAARAPDGIIEAIEWPGPGFCCGVQFHPERLPPSRRLFEEFVSAAQQVRG